MQRTRNENKNVLMQSNREKGKENNTDALEARLSHTAQKQSKPKMQKSDEKNIPATARKTRHTHRL